MKKHHFLLLLLMFGFMFSCEKEEHFDFPITLEFIEVQPKGNVRMFIGGKELFDQKLIKKYIETNRLTNFDPSIKYFDIKEIYSIFNSEKITFESKDSVQLGSGTIKSSVMKRSDLFLIKTEMIYSLDDMNAFPHRLKKYIAHSDLCDERCYNVVVVGRGNYNHLDISLTEYLYSSTYTGRGGRFQNEFNDDISFLCDKDTLAIQEYKLIYK